MIMKKDANKLLIILIGAADILLAAILCLTFFLPDIPDRTIGPDISNKFESNSDIYYENDSKEIYKSDVTINYNGSSIESNQSKTFSEAELIFPNSDTQKITTAEMDAKLKSRSDLRLAINEIYARHGYLFSNEEYLEYFNQFDWYQNTTKNSDMEAVSNQFSSVEKYNVEVLQDYSDAHGWS